MIVLLKYIDLSYVFADLAIIKRHFITTDCSCGHPITLKLCCNCPIIPELFLKIDDLLFLKSFLHNRCKPIKDWGFHYNEAVHFYQETNGADGLGMS